MAGQRAIRHNGRVEQQPLGVQPKRHGIYLAIVKRVNGSHGTGHMMVWVPDFGTGKDSNDTNTWIPISHVSPFSGNTPLEGNGKSKKYESSQTSYGMWMVPPDIGNSVVVGFANGDMDKGYCLGYVPQMFANRMTPGIAVGDAHDDNGDKLQIQVPQGEHNKLHDLNATTEPKSVNQENDHKLLRPHAKYHTEGLINQGLIADDIRGTTTASARRSSPSNSYGISTPGPAIKKIDNKQYTETNQDSYDRFKEIRRKGGSSFVMDDEEGSESVRIRTRSGAQMLLDESEGLVYFINRDGTAWMEMDADGNVDVFSAKSITMRAEEDINFRADRNITMEAGADIRMKAEKSWSGTPGAQPLGQGDSKAGGGNIYFEAQNDVLVFAKKNMQITVEDENLDVNVKEEVKLFSGSDMHIKTNANMKQESATDFNIKSTTKIKQTGQQGVHISDLTEIVINAPDLYLNDGAPTPADTATTASVVTKIPTYFGINVIYQNLKKLSVRDAIDMVIKSENRERSIKSIISRWITREPCPAKKHNKSSE